MQCQARAAAVADTHQEQYSAVSTQHSDVPSKEYCRCSQDFAVMQVMQSDRIVVLVLLVCYARDDSAAAVISVT